MTILNQESFIRNLWDWGLLGVVDSLPHANTDIKPTPNKARFDAIHAVLKKFDPDLGKEFLDEEIRKHYEKLKIGGGRG